MYQIKIHFEQKSGSSILLKDIHEGQSLLEVLLNNGINIRHDCGGACTCSTCHLLIHSGVEYLVEKSKREKDFLNKVQAATQFSRLACQSLLLNKDGYLEVTLPDQNESVKP